MLRSFAFGCTLAIAVSPGLSEALVEVPAFEDGNTLLANCTGRNPSDSDPESRNLSRAYCGGYITAISDALESGESLNGWVVCFPPNSNKWQIIDVVIVWLRNQPAQRHLAAADLVARALHDAFPC